MKLLAVLVSAVLLAVPVRAEENITETVKSEAGKNNSGEPAVDTGGSEKSAAVAGESTPDQPKEEGAETSAEEKIPGLTAGEKQQLQKQQAVKYERENAGTRFKQKAVAEAEKREAQKKELLEQQEKATTDFRRQAIERARERERERQEKIQEQQNKQSLFSDKARRNAERRAEKKRLKMERVNRRRSKPISGVPVK